MKFSHVDENCDECDSYLSAYEKDVTAFGVGSAQHRLILISF